MEDVRALEKTIFTHQTTCINWTCDLAQLLHITTVKISKVVGFFLSPLHWKNHALRDTFPIHHMKDHQLALLYNKKSHNLNHAY